jgi:cytochrome c-type biogenesis protein CcsB
MLIKTTPHMLLVYGAMLCYLIALATRVENSVFSLFAKMVGRTRPATSQNRSIRLAAIFYFLGFAWALAAFAVRWKQLHHVPLQSMFDIFLAMSMGIYPLTFLCRRLGARAEPFDIFLGLVLLFPVGFVFSDAQRNLPPALQSFLFIPHVAIYLLGSLIMAKAAAGALCHLVLGDRHTPHLRVMTPSGWKTEIKVSPTFTDLGEASGSQRSESELAVFRLVCLGFPFLTIGLILGSWWGQLAWGDYWGWDPKEMWSLATWLIFVLYFHLRYAWPDRGRLRDIIVLLGFAAIVITIVVVNLSRLFPGIHSYAS